MNPELDEARAQLEADGLIVKPSGEDALWVCATLQVADHGIQLSNDASMLLPAEGRWIAIFHGAGLLSYGVPGNLEDLVRLIRTVYANYRRHGGAFRDAFARSVPDPDSYLPGAPPEDLSTALSGSRPVKVGDGFGA